MRYSWIVIAVSLAAILISIISPAAGQNDNALAEAVRQRLEMSPSLGNAKIGIDVEQKKVTLTGRLGTLAAIEEAGRLAGRVNGTTEIVNEIRLDTSRVDPARLEEAARAALNDHLALSWADIRVTARRGGKIVLGGKVGDARLRIIARKAIAALEGVTAIEDRIETPEAADELIQKAVEGLFGRGDLVGMTGDIHAKVEDGAVTLTGTVPRPYERSRAGELTFGVNGVEKVINHLRVEPPSYEIPVVRP